MFILCLFIVRFSLCGNCPQHYYNPPLLNGGRCRYSISPLNYAYVPLASSKHLYSISVGCEKNDCDYYLLTNEEFLSYKSNGIVPRNMGRLDFEKNSQRFQRNNYDSSTGAKIVIFNGNGASVNFFYEISNGEGYGYFGTILVVILAICILGVLCFVGIAILLVVGGGSIISGKKMAEGVELNDYSSEEEEIRRNRERRKKKKKKKRKKKKKKKRRKRREHKIKEDVYIDSDDEEEEDLEAALLSTGEENSDDDDDDDDDELEDEEHQQLQKDDDDDEEEEDIENQQQQQQQQDQQQKNENFDLGYDY